MRRLLCELPRNIVEFKNPSKCSADEENIEILPAYDCCNSKSFGNHDTNFIMLETLQQICQ